MADKGQAKKIGRSLAEATRALRNVSSALVQKFPALTFMFFMLLIFIGSLVVSTRLPGLVFLCLLILVVSIGVYWRSRNFAETALTFVLGLFTVFTISWDKNLMWMFVVFFVAFAGIITIIGSVSLAAKKESILTQAAVYTHAADFKQARAELEKVVSDGTPHSQIDVIELADIVRYFVFRKVPLERIPNLLRLTEQIGVISHVEYPEVAQFVWALYRCHLIKHTYDPIAMDLYVERILEVPCRPEEFFEVFERTRKYMIAGTVDEQRYLDLVGELFSAGLTADDVVSAFDDRYPDVDLSTVV